MTFRWKKIKFPELFTVYYAEAKWKNDLYSPHRPSGSLISKWVSWKQSFWASSSLLVSLSLLMAVIHTILRRSIFSYYLKFCVSYRVLRVPPAIHTTVHEIFSLGETGRVMRWYPNLNETLEWLWQAYLHHKSSDFYLNKLQRFLSVGCCIAYGPKSKE